MAGSWLDGVTEKLMANLPKPRFAPSVVFEFDHVRAAIELLEGAIEASREETERLAPDAAIKAAADPHHDFIKDPVFAPVASVMWNVEMTFPLILRRSMLIAICAHVEHVLRRWCAFLHKEWSLSKDPNTYEAENKGKRGTQTLMRYIRDIAGLQIADFGNWPEWSKLDAYFVVRNALVHDGGIIDSDDKRRRIRTLRHIEIDESGLLLDTAAIVHLLPGACNDAASTAKALLERLNVACERDARVQRSEGNT